jgi:AcrR family transcriptional regulator
VKTGPCRSNEGVSPTSAPGRGASGAGGDGRRLRAARNRDSVVEAVIGIVREQGSGRLPGAAEVALRAGVSERTVFRHFADLDSLFLAAAVKQRPLLATYLGPRPDAKELDKRAAAVAKLRAKLYEEIAPLRRVAVRLAQGHQSLADQIAEADGAGRVQLAQVFAPELRKAGRAKATLLDELELVTSWTAWEHLRGPLGASPEKARKVVTDLLVTLLGPHASGRPSSPGPSRLLRG